MLDLTSEIIYSGFYRKMEGKVILIVVSVMKSHQF